MMQREPNDELEKWLKRCWTIQQINDGIHEMTKRMLETAYRQMGTERCS